MRYNKVCVCSAAKLSFCKRRRMKKGLNLCSQTYAKLTSLNRMFSCNQGGKEKWKGEKVAIVGIELQRRRRREEEKAKEERNDLASAYSMYAKKKVWGSPRISPCQFVCLSKGVKPQPARSFLLISRHCCYNYAIAMPNRDIFAGKILTCQF